MKKVRSKQVRFTFEEVEFLEKAYQKGPKNGRIQAKTLAETMGHEEKRIKKWFSHRRTKDENIFILSKQCFTDEQKEQLTITYQKKKSSKKHVIKKIAKTPNIKDVKRIDNCFAAKRISVHRPRYSKEQREYFMSIYAKRKYPPIKELSDIAEKFGRTTGGIRA